MTITYNQARQAIFELSPNEFYLVTETTEPVWLSVLEDDNLIITTGASIPDAAIYFGRLYGTTRENIAEQYWESYQYSLELEEIYRLEDLENALIEGTK